MTPMLASKGAPRGSPRLSPDELLEAAEFARRRSADDPPRAEGVENELLRTFRQLSISGTTPSHRFFVHQLVDR